MHSPSTGTPTSLSKARPPRLTDEEAAPREAGRLARGHAAGGRRCPPAPSLPVPRPGFLPILSPRGSPDKPGAGAAAGRRGTAPCKRPSRGVSPAAGKVACRGGVPAERTREIARALPCPAGQPGPGKQLRSPLLYPLRSRGPGHTGPQPGPNPCRRPTWVHGQAAPEPSPCRAEGRGHAGNPGSGWRPTPSTVPVTVAACRVPRARLLVWWRRGQATRGPGPRDQCPCKRHQRVASSPLCHVRTW